MILRFIEKVLGIWQEKKTRTVPVNSQEQKKQLRAPASETVDDTKGLEKAVSPVCRIDIKECTTVAIKAVHESKSPRIPGFNHAKNGYIFGISKKKCSSSTMSGPIGSLLPVIVGKARGACGQS